MPGQFPTSMGSIAAVATLLACVGIPTTIARAADCLTAPYFSAPEGSQWYYQTDRATKRKCWFLRAKNQSTQQPAAQAESEAAPATRTTAFEQPATASIGVRNSAASQTSAQPAGPAAGVGAGVPTTIARADDCLTAPNSPAPAGRRWSYRTDRSTQRKCWYLRAADGRTQHTDAQAPSTVAPAKKTRALENATASAGAPLSKSSAEGVALAVPQARTNGQRDDGGPCRPKRSGGKYFAIKSGATLAADRSGDFTGDRRWVTRSPRGYYGQCGGTQCRCERCPR